MDYKLVSLFCCFGLLFVSGVIVADHIIVENVVQCDLDMEKNHAFSMTEDKNHLQYNNNIYNLTWMGANVFLSVPLYSLATGDSVNSSTVKQRVSNILQDASIYNRNHNCSQTEKHNNACVRIWIVLELSPGTLNYNETGTENVMHRNLSVEFRLIRDLIESSGNEIVSGIVLNISGSYSPSSHIVIKKLINIFKNRKHSLGMICSDPESWCSNCPNLHLRHTAKLDVVLFRLPSEQTHSLKTFTSQVQKYQNCTRIYCKTIGLVLNFPDNFSIEAKHAVLNEFVHSLKESKRKETLHFVKVYDNLESLLFNNISVNRVLQSPKAEARGGRGARIRIIPIRGSGSGDDTSLWSFFLGSITLTCFCTCLRACLCGDNDDS